MPKVPVFALHRLALSGALYLAAAFCTATAAPAPVRVTASGPVQGVAAGDVLAFKAIPYAAAPLGPLRWQPPQAPVAWTAPRDASQFGPACPQPEASWMESMPQSEDCLTLNIWTPARGENLPVAVWIHGGSHVAGSGAEATFDGTGFARDGVVLVTLNYRLGALGFFAHPDLPVSANFGYMDMVAALEWVRDNIAAFGGDPSRVTLMGESAGGMAVNVLMASPVARGLFARAISQSGAESGVRPAAEAMEAGQQLARAAGATGLAALRDLPWQALLEGASGQIQVGPFLDGVTVPEQPPAAFASARTAQVPFLIGATSREAAGMGTLSPEEAQQRLDALLVAYPAQAEEARRIYEVDRVGPVEALVQILSDAGEVEAARYCARLHQPSWLYRFSYVASKDRGIQPGAPHGSELPYVFDTAGWPTTQEDRQAIADVHGTWVRFIRTGDPGWPAVSAEAELVMDFSVDGPRLGPDPLNPRLDLIEAAKARSAP